VFFSYIVREVVEFNMTVIEELYELVVILPNRTGRPPAEEMRLIERLLVFATGGFFGSRL